ncbi:MAG: Cof-type HAD-IIB family hydrolase [Tissierellia bacterium]|nr:Cof-type HAD-IIB family hydrolase [Tissierellia bacterium]
MIKLIVSDLDNTLLSDDHINVSDENKKAIAFAKEQGAQFAIATGRTASLVEPIYKKLGLVDYLILSNGAGILDMKTMKETGVFIPFDLFEKLVTVHDRYNAIYEIYADGKVYIKEKLWDNYGSEHLDPDFVKELKSFLIPINNIEELKDKSIEKINTIMVPNNGRKAMMKDLEELGGLTVTSALKGNVEVTLEGVDKGAALHRLAKRLGIEKDEVLVFGDGMNDYTMIQWSSNSYAMENGHPEVKKIAKHITKRYDENGVAHGIYEYMK